MVGGHRTGKSSLLRRYLLDCYTAQYLPTVAVDVHNRMLGQTHADQMGAPVRIQFWDISHAELRGRCVSKYLVGVHCALLVFDITDRRSVQYVDAWRKQIEENAKPGFGTRASGDNGRGRGKSPIPLYLLVNKEDGGRHVVQQADLELYARQCGYRGWWHTSARSGLNVREAFSHVVDTIVEQVAYTKLEARCQEQLASAMYRDLSGGVSPLVPAMASAQDMSRSMSNGSEDGSAVSRAESPAQSTSDVSAAALATLMQLREVEMKGNTFFLGLAGQLAMLLRLVPAEWQADVVRLEEQREREYAEFTARCSEAYNSSSQFQDASADEVSAEYRQSASVKLSADIVLQLNVFLAKATAVWQAAISQLEMTVALTSAQAVGLIDPANTNAAPLLQASSAPASRPRSASLDVLTSLPQPQASDAVRWSRSGAAESQTSPTYPSPQEATVKGFGVRNAGFKGQAR